MAWHSRPFRRFRFVILHFLIGLLLSVAMLLTAAMLPVRFTDWVSMPGMAPEPPPEYVNPKAARFTGFGTDIVTTAYMLAHNVQLAARSGVDSTEVLRLTTPRPNSDKQYYLRKACGYPLRCAHARVDELGTLHGGLDWGRFAAWRTNEQFVTKVGDRISGTSTPGLPPSRVIPYAPIWPGLLVNTLFYAAITALLHLTFTTTRRAIRRRRHRCPHCGYDTHGLTTPTCPECGHDTNRLF